MTITADSKVGKLAAEHPLATRVFARRGIDFCCAGGLDLATACDTKGVDVQQFITELEQEIAAQPDADLRWDDKPLAALIDHILVKNLGDYEAELVVERILDELVTVPHSESGEDVVTPLSDHYGVHAYLP